MARPTMIALGIAGALVVAAGAVVLSESPQKPVPLAVVQPTPTPTASPTPSPSAPPAPAPTPTPTAPATPTVPGPIQPMLLNNGPREVPKIAITFDTPYNDAIGYQVTAGSLPRQVNADVLNVLEATGTPATVFVTGQWANAYPDAMGRMSANPLYEIGNHTWSHSAWSPDCYGLDPIGDLNVQKFEVRATADVIAKYTGYYPTLFRFPALCGTEAALAVPAEIGEVTIGSDVPFSDAYVTDVNSYVATVVSQAQNGSILLLNLNGPPNAPATAQILEALIPALKAKGLQPVKVSDLIAGIPGVPAAPVPVAKQPAPAAAPGAQATPTSPAATPTPTPTPTPSATVKPVPTATIDPNTGLRSYRDPKTGLEYIDPYTGLPYLDPNTGRPFVNPDTGQPYVQ